MSIIELFEWLKGFLAWLKKGQKSRKERKTTIRHAKMVGFGPLDVFEHTAWYVSPNILEINDHQPSPATSSLTAARYFKDFLALGNTVQSPHYLIVMNEAGVGKTSLLLYHVLLNERLLFSQKNELLLVRLKMPGKMVHDALEAIPESERYQTVVLLDGFDEDTSAHRDPVKRISELGRLCHDFRKVVITTRPLHFGIIADTLPLMLGRLTHPDSMGAENILATVKLMNLTDKQVNQVLFKRFPRILQLGRIRANRTKRRQARAVIAQIDDVAFRPMVLHFIHNLVGVGPKHALSNIWQIYDAIVTHWHQREESKGQFDDETIQIVNHVCMQVAWDSYIGKGEQEQEKGTISGSRLKALVKAAGIGRNLELNVLERALMRRRDDDQWEFLHESLREFLFVKRFLTAKTEERELISWTGLMKQFARVRLEKETNLSFVDLSGGDLTKLDLKGKDFTAARLEGAKLQGAKCQRALFRRSILDECEMDEHTILDGADFEGASLKRAVVIRDLFNNAHNCSREQIDETVEPMQRSQNISRYGDDVGISFDEESLMLFSYDAGVFLQQPYIGTLGYQPCTLAVFESFMRENVLVDAKAASSFLEKVLNTTFRRLAPDCSRVTVTFPFGARAVDKVVLRTAVKAVGFLDCGLIDEAVAAAVGAGINIRARRGSMVVYIGDDRTDVAVVAMEGIVLCRRCNISENSLYIELEEFIKVNYNVTIDKGEARRIVMICGLPNNQSKNGSIDVRCYDRELGVSIEVGMDFDELQLVIANPFTELSKFVHSVLQQCSLEIFTDLTETGISLTGALAKTPGLRETLESKTSLTVRVADNCESALVRGAAKIIKEYPDLFETLKMRSSQS